ncbi:hypothetical protein EYF80_028496 [Liparis tanakae]|uniref:Uncharacterized protein n=1 Tax=Liparis tanakae TaxID=230148 RepID=A0A4Z2H8E1_9TELE|nr:hypothetical protein EYF80_028496 [Liparis tanakae]
MTPSSAPCSPSKATEGDLTLRDGVAARRGIDFRARLLGSCRLLLSPDPQPIGVYSFGAMRLEEEEEEEEESSEFSPYFSQNIPVLHTQSNRPHPQAEHVTGLRYGL